jgi:hypothetical protein
MYFNFTDLGCYDFLVKHERAYTLTNLTTETYHVLAVSNVLHRRDENEPLEVRAKVTLTGKSGFNGYFLVGGAYRR